MNARRSGRRCGAWVVVGVMVFAAWGFAAEPAPDKEAPLPEAAKPKADEAKIARLIKQLGSDSYKQRQAAQAALVVIGKPAIPQLEKALKSPDAEVRVRAKRALEDIRKSDFERASEAIAKNVLWKLDVAEGISGAPVATGTAVLLLSGDGKLRAVRVADHKGLWDSPADPKWPLLVTDSTAYVRDADGSLQAVDLKTGKPVEGFAPVKVAGPAAYADGVIYVADSMAGFVALDARTGKQRWKVPMAKFYIGTGPKKAVASRDSPVVAKGLVFISTGGDIVALDVQKGEEKWKAPAGKAAVRSLTLCQGLLIARTSAALQAFDLDGKAKWELPLPGGQVRTMIRRVVVINGQKVVITNDSAVRSREMAVADGMIYVSDGGKLVAVDAKAGKEKWSCEPKGDSAAEADRPGGGTVIMNGGGKVQFAVWAGVGQAGRGTGLTSPVAGDAVVYVGSKAGLHAIDPKTRQQLWRLKTSQPVFGRPVVRDGVVYFVAGAHGAGRGDLNARGVLPSMGARLYAVRLKAKD